MTNEVLASPTGWTIEEGNLCFGEDIKDETGHVRSWRFKEDYGKQFVLKSVCSKDSKYCAIWREKDLGHIDVWALEPRSRLPGGPLVDWPVFKFTVKHNRYHKSVNYVAVFVEREGVTYFLTCQKHGCLHLLDMQGQLKFHYDMCDYFIDYLITVNDKYVLIMGWMWTPFYSASLVPIEDLFKDPIHGVSFSVWEEGEKINTKTLASLIHDEKTLAGVCEWIEFYRKTMGCSTPEESEDEEEEEERKRVALHEHDV